MRLIDADKITYHEIDEIGGEYAPYLGCSKEQIENMPTVDVETVIHGKWLMPGENYSNKIWRKCSNCNKHIEKYSKYVSFTGNTEYFEHILNYCPLCGAKMDKE